MNLDGWGGGGGLSKYTMHTIYRVDRKLPQICTASAQVNMKRVLMLMQYRFAVIYETLSTIVLFVEERVEGREDS